MLSIEKLGLSARQWQFLCDPKVLEPYVKESGRAGRTLAIESTRRQFVTARDILDRLNGSYGQDARRGILLADDVGLGKTTVAALVAWVVASSGEKRKVRILAPNDVMMRRWVEELNYHVEPLQVCAKHLDVRKSCVKSGRVGRLSAGSIQVIKHSYAASDLILDCDLLIVDEAHRAKGESTAFSKALNRQKRNARRVLILTATPFSIEVLELRNMLTLIGGEEAHRPVTSFSRALNNLYWGNTAQPAQVAAQRLAQKAKGAVEALSSCVIRHGIDDLKNEHKSFGSREDWEIVVPPAREEEVELMLRMDRALRLAKHSGCALSKVTNDARFHVGWGHFKAERDSLIVSTQELVQPVRSLISNHLQAIKQLLKKVGTHSKIEAVAGAVASTIEQGEKVVLFCHHHATAQELTIHLADVLPQLPSPRVLSESIWRRTWGNVIPWQGDLDNEHLRSTFIDWLCSDLIRAQTFSWLRTEARSEAMLVDALTRESGRHTAGTEVISKAAVRLYQTLLKSKSSRNVLKQAANYPELLPGANGTSRVLGVCEPDKKGPDRRQLFIHNQQPDTVISIFNSPFGPDVLVVTDKLSEGIDLHRYCRHLIHYELDPSPIRTVQRNGRLRRVNSWAAVTGQPIRYAYPAFSGTRDHRLVQIMKKRVDSFSLLLGGVQDFNVEEVEDSDEAWRNSVIAAAKADLAIAGGRLCALATAG